MKTYLAFASLLLTMASSALAQDYYSPTDKEKEPFARFPLESIRVSTTAKGEKVISYALPKQLTGKAMSNITATEVQTNLGLPSDIRIYSSPQATITCMGTEEKPGCMVAHHNLAIDSDAANLEIDRLYYDPQSRTSAKAVKDDFIGHSGNQPIGVLGGLKPREKDTPKLPSGSMITQYEGVDENGKPQLVKATVNWNSKSFLADDGKNPRFEGIISPGAATGNRVVGEWQALGSKGWFEFNFDNNKKRFEGTYGFGAPGSPRAGRWSTN